MPASKLACCILRCSKSHRERLVDFYSTRNGMRLEENGSVLTFSVPKENGGSWASVRFLLCDVSDEAPVNDKTCLYWKVGFAVHDLDNGRAGLTDDNKVAVSNPVQFFDIGYLCNLKDPAGFTIELLQTTFEKNSEPRKRFIETDSRPIKSPALRQAFGIGQITLRVSNAERSCSFYTNVMKMKLLSVQPVPQYNFVLYFFAYTNDTPPNTDDLHDVANREWCWQRSYTTLELFHAADANSMDLPAGDAAGFAGIEIEAEASVFADLKAQEGFKGDDSQGSILDPDGTVIQVTRTSS